MGDPLSMDRRIFYLGDFTWNSMSGRSVGLKPVPLQSLSELERVRLQDVSFCRLLQDYDLGCHVTIPKDGQKRKKSLRRKLDSLAKEKSKDKDSTPQAFGLLLSQVIANDRAHKQRQDPRRRREAAEELRDPGEPFAPSVQPSSHGRRGTKELSSSNSSLSSTSETPGECPVPSVPEAGPYTRRRGGVSVDCITDLDDNQSRLLEALQLSLPSEASGNPKKQRDKKLSLNPIYRQVPRVVNCCCQHLEKYGLQTVGVFRVGSSKKRVRQLREEYDQGLQVQLDEENSVHDVAALLKEFLRDMPDPLLTRELYTAFINTLLLDHADQDSALQLLIYLLPPCNSDTLQCLLHFLATVAAHADNSQDGEGQEITGNKMTPLNLATIFGPNLLHKQKISDKEFAVQSFARAEESTAIIGVVQRMITTQETLFMVPPDLQNEVLVSLLETDPDVVDYLLRRKASQYSDPVLLRTESFSLSERGSSSDSNKASSGEVSPYDNNSPVLSERLVWQFQGDGNLLKLPGQYSKGRSGDTCPSPTNEKEGQRENVGSWGAWHAKLKKEFIEQHTIGRLGDVNESDPHDSSEGLDSHRGNSKPPVRRTQTSLGLPECRPHPPLTRCSSSPQEPWEMRQPVISLLPPPPCGQTGACSFEDFLARGTPPVSPSMRGKPGSDSRTVSRPPPPYPGPLRATPVSHSNPVLSTEKQVGGGTALASRQGHKGRSLSPQRGSSGPASRSVEGRWPGSTERPREKWQIWQLLSPDNGDTLPETLV